MRHGIVLFISSNVLLSYLLLAIHLGGVLVLIFNFVIGICFIALKWHRKSLNTKQLIFSCFGHMIYLVILLVTLVCLENFAITDPTSFKMSRPRQLVTGTHGVATFSVYDMNAYHNNAIANQISALYYGTQARQENDFVVTGRLDVFASDSIRLRKMLELLNLSNNTSFEMLCFREADAIFDEKRFLETMVQAKAEILWVQHLYAERELEQTSFAILCVKREISEYNKMVLRLEAWINEGRYKRIFPRLSFLYKNQKVVLWDRGCNSLKLHRRCDYFHFPRGPSNMKLRAMLQTRDYLVRNKNKSVVY